MGLAIDITGQRFGRLVAIKKTDQRKDKKIVWEFICDCGNKALALAKAVKCGNTKSCGCLRLDAPKIYSQSNGKRKEKNCVHCASTFTIKLSQYERANYCSKKCKNEDQKTKLLNENNPHWKGGISFCKQHINNRSKIWRDKNLDKISIYNRTNKLKRKGAKGSHTNEDIRKIYELQKGRCAYCKKKVNKKYHVDHIIPISKGGNNDKYNICISCPTCNLKKWNKTPDQWAFERGMIL